MPRNSRKAKAQHVRNHKRAAKRQAARNDRHSGRKTLPVSQRSGGGISYQFMRAMGQLFMADAGITAAPAQPRLFTGKKQS